MRAILFDITRLNSRKRASTPSGIDRVDLRYFEHFQQPATRHVIAWLGCYFAVKPAHAAALQRGLKRKWLGFDAVRLPLLPQLLDASWLELGWVTLRNLLPEKWGLAQSLSRNLEVLLSQGSWRYVNTSHVQVRSIPGLRALATRFDVQPLFFIHDLIPITHREYVRPGGATQHLKRLQLLSDTQADVIVNSNYTRDCLLAWAQAHSAVVVPQRVRMIAIGVEPEFLSPRSTPAPLAEPYFLMLGTIEPRKNHLLVLKVWRRMVEQGVANIPKLVIIGKRGWENENIVDMLERCEPIQSYLIEKQHVADGELQAWLQHCEALIYPSFVEGWGMPVAEALAMGVHVICSDIAPFSEVGQGIPDYIDPLDGPQLQQAVMKVMGNTPRGGRIGYQAPTWEAHFDALDRWL